MAATLLAAGLLTTALLGALGAVAHAHPAATDVDPGATPGSWSSGAVAEPAQGQRTDYAFGWDVAVGTTPSTGSGSSVGGDGSTATFDVPAGTHAIVVDAAWKCTQGICSAAIELIPPGGSTQTTGPVTVTMPPPAAASKEGTGTVQLRLENPVAGSWTVAAQPTGPSVGAAGIFGVTLVC